MLLAMPLAVLPFAPASAAGVTNGPVYVSGFPEDTLRRLDGTVDTALGFEGGYVSTLSPAGDKVVFSREECVDDACTAEQATIVVRDHDGTVQEYGPFNEHIWSMAWSPDASQVAFMSTNNTTGTDTLFRLPLTATAPISVATDSDTQTLDQGSEIDWGGAGILFVGTVGDVDSLQPVDADQLYTVSPDGGGWKPVNVHYPRDPPAPDPPVCNAGDVCYDRFLNPEWSPDGTKIVAEIIEVRSERADTRFLGTIAPGGKVPTRLTSLRSADLGYASFVGPIWSPDGTMILFNDDDGTDFYAATITAAGGSRTRLPAANQFAADWQACPDGVCADWGLIPTSTSLIYGNVNVIKASGTVSPAVTGTVNVILKKQKSGTWKKVAAKTVPLDGASHYSAQFAKPAARLCQLTARYQGNSTHAPSQMTKFFTC
jgi:hypothetical protein